MSHLESPNNAQNSCLKDGLGRQTLCLCCFSLLNKLSWSCVFMMEHSEGRAYLCCWSVKGSTRHISNAWLSNTFKQTSSFEGSFGWIVLMPHKEYNVVLEIFLVILTVERMQFQSGLLQSKKSYLSAVMLWDHPHLNLYIRTDVKSITPKEQTSPKTGLMWVAKRLADILHLKAGYPSISIFH